MNCPCFTLFEQSDIVTQTKQMDGAPIRRLVDSIDVPVHRISRNTVATCLQWTIGQDNELLVRLGLQSGQVLLGRLGKSSKDKLVPKDVEKVVFKPATAFLMDAARCSSPCLAKWKGINQPAQDQLPTPTDGRNPLFLLSRPPYLHTVRTIAGPYAG